MKSDKVLFFMMVILPSFGLAYELFHLFQVAPGRV